MIIFVIFYTSTSTNFLLLKECEKNEKKTKQYATSPNQ